MEAEQSLLGAILLDPSTIERINGLVHEPDFYTESHQLIYRSMMKLAEDSSTIDPLTVYEKLESDGLADRVGPFTYIGQLAAQTPSAAAARQYAEIVRDRALRRRVIETSRKLISSAITKDGRSAEELIDEAEESVLKLAESGKSQKESFHSADAVLERVLGKMEHLAANPPENGIIGTPTGYDDLDKLMSGFHGGALMILAARPAMGKTALALNIAENIAIDTKLPVAVFSMEMGAEELMTRVLGSRGRIDQTRMRTVNFTNDDWERVADAVGNMKDAPIFIDDTPGMTVFDIRSRVRKLSKRVGKIGLIVVDYLQLLSSTSTRQENRAVVVGEFSRALKLLAMELNVPILALSQLNRAVEQRPNKRPGMADLRDSGALEQDADVCMFIYRDEKYNPETTDKGIAEVILGKHRAGPVGVVKLAFREQYTRFENLAPSTYGYSE
jgi:replicative DNA helicase